MTDDRVDAYLAGLPPGQRRTLQDVRVRIRRTAPDATETISYGMPAFTLDGRFLVSYAGWKSHASIYPLTDSFLAAHADRLEGYGRTKGSLHFTERLPDGLLEELVRARLVDLEAGGR